MRFNNKMRFMPMILVLLLVCMMAVPMTTSTVYAAETPVDLGTASAFGILAGSGITNTGATWVGGSAGGNIGLHPTPAFTGLAQMTVTGEVYAADGVALQAQNDLGISYVDVAGRTPSTSIPAELGGSTLTSGVYTSVLDTFEITGTLTLDGGDDPNSVFIFQAGSTLTTASASRIELINGAQACNVFWQVGSSATLGTYSTFVGQILASESITATTGAAVQGQLLALGGAVTLDNNTIINDNCGSTTGSLRVAKVVQGPVSGMTLPSFSITITGPGYTNGDTRTIVSGSSYTWTGLAPGLYTVSEAALSQEWSVSGILEQGYNVQGGQITQVIVTNTYTPPDDSSNGSDNDSSSGSTTEQSTGELTVTKVVSGDIGDMTLPNFEITVTGPEDFSDTRSFDHDESYTWENLVPGTYTVTESRTGLSSEWRVSGEGTVRVRADQTAVKTITNAYFEDDLGTGELTVTKVVNGNIGDMTLPLYGITVTGPAGFLATRTFDQGESYTWENLVPGEYTVTESRTGLSTDWTVSGEGTVQVVADQTTMTTITNAYTEDELLTPDQTDVVPIITSDDETPVLGIVELPRTGGNPFLMIFTGLFLSGIGFMLRKKEY